MNDHLDGIPIDKRDYNVQRKCLACGDLLVGHEDESSTLCRWCVTGWKPTDAPTASGEQP